MVLNSPIQPAFREKGTTDSRAVALGGAEFADTARIPREGHH
jgi:hypothetical protein